jgi:hypothetical protein
MHVLECPNCGSGDFGEIAPNKHRCAYCGTIITSPGRPPDRVWCPQCGFENERGGRYCNQCGTALAGPAPVRSTRLDPALVSIIVTVAGSMFVPLTGAIIGLILAYKARRDIQTDGGQGRSEKLARTAVIVGWGGVALGALPLCLMVTASGAQMGITVCGDLFHALSNAVTGAIRR